MLQIISEIDLQISYSKTIVLDFYTTQSKAKIPKWYEKR